MIERQWLKLAHVARVGYSIWFGFSKHQSSSSAKADLQFDNYCSLIVPTHFSLPKIALGIVFHRSQPGTVTLGPNPDHDPDPLTFLYGIVQLCDLYRRVRLEILCNLNTIFVRLERTVPEI